MSDKTHYGHKDVPDKYLEWIPIEDVKEAIKEIKEDMEKFSEEKDWGKISCLEVEKIFKKRFGERLT